MLTSMTRRLAERQPRSATVVRALRRVIAGLIVAGVFAPAAHAATADFCGVLVTSGVISCPGPLSSSYGTWWTYTSNTYNGSGTISQMRVYMADTQHGYFTQSWYANNTTFVHGCWYRTIASSDYGLLYQWESTGARHTLDGHNDDSPNHTFGCIPDYSVTTR